MQGVSNLTVANSTLTGIRTLDTGWRGIYCYDDGSAYNCHNITIHDTDVTYWTGYAIDVKGTSYTFPAENINIYEVDVSHSVTGIYVGHVDGVKIHGVTADDNLMGPNTTGLEEYGIATSEAQNCEIYDFTITNGRCGIEIWSQEGNPTYPDHGPSHNISIHHGKISGNTEHGILNHTGNTHGGLFYRIDIYNNGYGGITWNDVNAPSTNITIRLLSLYNNNTRGAGFAEIYLGGVCAGLTILNNIMFNITGYCLRSGNYTTQAMHRHNCYWKTSGSLIDDHGTFYTAATGPTWETDGGRFADPKFVSTTPGSEDLKTQSDSPCIDVAENVGDNVDIDGLPNV